MLASALPLLSALVLAQGAPTAAPKQPPRPMADPATKSVLAGDAGPVLPLDEALREAEAKNTDVRQARARLEQADAQVAKARAGYLPQVSATATYTRNWPEVAFPFPSSYAVVRPATPPAPPPAGSGTPTGDIAVPNAFQTIIIQGQNQLGAQLQATQAILAPPLWFSISAARRGSESASETIESARRDVLFGVAQSYYGAVALRKAIAVQERQLATALAHEKDARLRFDTGSVPKVTLLRAQIDRVRADQDLKRSRNAYQSAKVTVATLLDRRDTAFEVDVPAAPEVPSGGGEELEESAVRERPDVRAAGANLAAQREAKKAISATYLPTVGAFLRAQLTNVSGFAGRYDTWAAGLQASWNIFDGGLREAQLRESSGRIAEAEAARAGAENRSRQEVRQALLDLDSAVANRAKASEQVALARENQRLVEVNFQAGAATYLEVSDASIALVSGELGLVSESLNADLAALRLLKASGRFAAPATRPR